MIYDYECFQCKHQILDVQQGLKEKPKRKCPQCKRLSLERVLLSAPRVHCSNITTLGQQAEKNFKKRGKYKASEDALDKKERDAANSAFLGSLSKKDVSKLAKMTKKQQQNYIMTGKGL